MCVHTPESLMRLEMRRGLEKESKGIRELLCGKQRLKLQINSLFLINYQLQLQTEIKPAQCKFTLYIITR